jgi:hypothetical protein
MPVDHSQIPKPEILQQLPLLKDMLISRCVKPVPFGEIISSQLHVFSDASFMGYGSAAYLRLIDQGENIHCSFLLCKARLASLKQTSIPRLELTAGTVAVRLGRLLLQELDIHIDKIFYYTDSTTVLHYLLNQKKRFPIFIANRIQFILDYSKKDDWRYVDSKINPADCASRGMNVQDITNNSVWLRGPEFIWNDDELTWPSQPTLAKDYAICEESVKSSAVTVNIEPANATEKLINYFSDWFRLKHAVSVYRKVMQILQDRRNHHFATDYRISVTDIEAAKHHILIYVQSHYFHPEIKFLMTTDPSKHGRVPRKSSIYKLDPYMEQGLLRVGGRLSKSNIIETMKHPVLLPKKSHITMLIMRSVHAKLAHAGRNHILARLRESYWIIHANSAVRNMITSCITCRKLRKPPAEQKMSDLPPERCKTSPPPS